mgnify:FL=1
MLLRRPHGADVFGRIHLLGCLFLCGHNLTQGTRQLVGTRGGLHAATDTFDFREDVLHFHAADEAANPLEVAVAAAVNPTVFRPISALPL